MTRDRYSPVNARIFGVSALTVTTLVLFYVVLSTASQLVVDVAWFTTAVGVLVGVGGYGLGEIWRHYEA